MTAAELVASKKHILLDFDGPVCAAFAGYGAENISRQLAMLIEQGGEVVPPELFVNPDPFEALRYAAMLGDADLLREVDAEFRRLEVLAVRVAPPTPQAVAVMHKLLSAGHSLSIVSNNSVEAIQAYASQHKFAAILTSINARTDADPSLLKPNPHLLECALSAHVAGRSESVMVGDSASDISAANAAHIAAIGLANKAGKRARLVQAGASVIIDRVDELLEW